jgi:phosphomannomutase
MSDLNLSMFRAYDIRTPAKQLTDDLAIRLTRAEAVYFREGLGVSGVLIAHDARTSGPHYLQIAAEEFARAGLTVVTIPGVCSTSQFYFAAMRHPQHAAVMFGASHNPAGDTGQKILGPGVRPIAEKIGPEGGLDKIRELYEREASLPPASSSGRIYAFDPTEDYLNYSMKLAGVAEGGLRGLKLFHDYLNGAAGREMMLAFERAGADLTPMHFAADGRFPLGDPNPVKQTVIRSGLKTLTSGDYLFGTFFDGDGDRIDFYRGDGTYLSSSFVYAAILKVIRNRFSGAGMSVFADLKANPLAVMEMAKTGVEVRIIRNGHSQIKNAMFDDPAMFGTVEESAHFYEAFLLDGSRYCTENTLYIALLAAREWMEEPARFEALFEIQARGSREREWGYKFPDDAQRARALEAVQAFFEEQGAQAMTHMPNGYALEATMMRRGIPFNINADTRLSADWLQVCQRVSQSENGLARWEVVAATQEIALEAKANIAAIVAEYGAGEEYQG